MSEYFRRSFIMLCEKCKKKEATVHIKEFHGTECETHHLCSDCAKENAPQMALNELGFNLADMLFDVEKFAKTLQEGREKNSDSAEPVVKCPVCNWDADMIRNTGGKLGCTECYKTFSGMLKPAVNQMQKGVIHLGKRPALTGNSSHAVLQSELTRLQNELKKLIAGEEYESAAVCRDRINALKEQLAALDDVSGGEA